MEYHDDVKRIQYQQKRKNGIAIVWKSLLSCFFVCAVITCHDDPVWMVYSFSTTSILYSNKIRNNGSSDWILLRFSKQTNTHNNNDNNEKEEDDTKKNKEGKKNSSSSVLPFVGTNRQKYRTKMKRRRHRTSSQKTNNNDNDENLSLLPPLFPNNKNNNNKYKNEKKNVTTNSQKSSSLLPNKEDQVWKEFFMENTKNQKKQSSSSSTTASLKNTSNDNNNDNRSMNHQGKTSSKGNYDNNYDKKKSSKTLTALDGVLPVSELFYRSTQSISSESTNTESTKRSKRGSSGGDDEELPFSAEQSDCLTTDNNQIRVRRNTASTSTKNNNDDDDNNVAQYKSLIAQQQQQKKLQQQQQQQQQATGSNNNKNSIKKKKKKKTPNVSTSSNTAKKTDLQKPKSKRYSSSEKRGRKMVRRGMEMLVGGEPINADPPLRNVDLQYHRKEKDWAKVISINTRDFGPLLHVSSISKVSTESRGYYCEHFVNAALKWKVCPKHLRSIVQTFESQQLQQLQSNAVEDYNQLLQLTEQQQQLVFMDTTALLKNDTASTTTDEQSIQTLLQSSVSSSNKNRKEKVDNDSIESMLLLQPNDDDDDIDDINETNKKKKYKQTTSSGKGFGRGFGTMKQKESSSNNIMTKNRSNDRKLQRNIRQQSRDEYEEENNFVLGGELKFTIGVTRADLESADKRNKGYHVLRRVLAEGISNSINAPNLGYMVVISKLHLHEMEDGSTEISLEFLILPKQQMQQNIYKESTINQINAALAQGMEDGALAMSLASVVRREKAWPSKLRDLIVEELLFDNMEEEDNDIIELEEDDPINADDRMEKEVLDAIQRQKDSPPNNNKNSEEEEGEEYDGPFGTPEDTMYAPDDLFLGGGNSGVFFDYSPESGESSPFGGALGPILVEDVVQRAIQRQPRVIAVGDVHGCLDELQALLRKCNYQPGDVVIFLGDLVSKGPDSLSVVQMAREIGAIGVRGNHDFEVIRWHQAIKSGTSKEYSHLYWIVYRILLAHFLSSSIQLQINFGG